MPLGPRRCWYSGGMLVCVTWTPPRALQGHIASWVADVLRFTQKQLGSACPHRTRPPLQGGKHRANYKSLQVPPISHPAPTAGLGQDTDALLQLIQRTSTPRPPDGAFGDGHGKGLPVKTAKPWASSPRSRHLSSESIWKQKLTGAGGGGRPAGSGDGFEGTQPPPGVQGPAIAD